MVTQESEIKKVSQYYNATYFDYFWVLALWRHWGMHFGFYDTFHKTLGEAILNMNAVLAQKAGIQNSSKVLDAGCGVGGSSIWIAKNIGASVVGITLVEEQVAKARRLAKKYGVESKTEFLRRDFLSTGFPDSSFDIVWAIESVCYAEHKRDFLSD